MKHLLFLHWQSARRALAGFIRQPLGSFLTLLLLAAPNRVAALLAIENAPPYYLSFAGAFVLQWAIGGFIDRLQVAGFPVADAHRTAFAALFALQAAAWLWLVLGGRWAARQDS